MARTKEFDEDLVLDKAVTLFWSKGYNGTSAQDLVDNLGISRSSLYGTYGDKRTLFIKALQRYHDKQSAAFVEMAGKPGSAAKAIAAVFNSLASAGGNPSIPFGCFMVNTAVELGPHDPEIAELVNSDARLVEEALALMVRKGQESGEFSNSNSPNSLASFLFNNIRGMRVAARSGASKEQLDDLIKNLLYVLK